MLTEFLRALNLFSLHENYDNFLKLRLSFCVVTVNLKQFSWCLWYEFWIIIICVYPVGCWDDTRHSYNIVLNPCSMSVFIMNYLNFCGSPMKVDVYIVVMSGIEQSIQRRRAVWRAVVVNTIWRIRWFGTFEVTDKGAF